MSSAVHGFLNPKGVALFGSMREGWFFGAGVVIKDLLDLGYEGAICPVHPSAQSVYGLKVSRDVCQCDAPVDLAVVITSCRQVPEILRKCGSRGIGSAVVVSDGFGENGVEGRARQEELLGIARDAGIRLIGPNTLGVFNPAGKFSTVPYEKGYGLPPEGPLSIITQTGMYGPQAALLKDFSFGIRSIVDLGNMCDIDETDCLAYLGDDPGTGVISVYMEHTRRPREFLRTAREISKRKPVLCLKGGRSAEAADAMASHTGSLAGSDGLYEGLFGQSGVVRVDEYEDLLDCAKVFTRGLLPGGNRLGIITLTGAIGIQCIDLGAAAGLVPGRLTSPSRDRLAGISPTLGGHPIDLGPASAMDGPALFDHYMKCFDILMADPEVDCVYLNLYIGSFMAPELYEGVFAHIESNMEKPVVMWSYGPVKESVTALNALGESHGIPAYTTTGKAVRSLGHLARYARWREKYS